MTHSTDDLQSVIDQDFLITQSVHVSHDADQSAEEEIIQLIAYEHQDMA